MRSIFICFFLFFSVSHAFSQDDLDQFINRMKSSKASGGKETGFLTPGSDFIYGQEYFEAKKYDMAAMYFERSQKAEPDNAYYNYLFALALIKQNDKYKTQQAQPYLDKAYQLNANLKARFETDLPPVAQRQPVKNETNTQVKKENKGAANIAAQGLDAYIEELKYSSATGGAKTAMLSAGREVLYGYDYYLKGEYWSAASRFSMAVAADKDDIYANYLLGVSLAAQGKDGSAYLAKAIAGDPQLKTQSVKDIASAKATFQKKEAAKKPVANTPEKEKAGGKLFMGSYVCRLAVWNGPNTSPAYRYTDQGSITLRADGTYKWLDNGEVGKYSYDARTGTIKWLSGHMVNYKIKSSVFQPGDKVASITINFTDDYRWGCGCTK